MFTASEAAGTRALGTSAGAGLGGDLLDRTRKAKLVDGAQQFEGVMLEEMLKPLHFGAAPDADGGEVTGAAGTIADFATEAMARALASKGGLGIARQIIQQVSREDEQLKQRSGGTKV